SDVVGVIGEDRYAHARHQARQGGRELNGIVKLSHGTAAAGPAGKPLVEYACRQRCLLLVAVPARAGIQVALRTAGSKWIPACAGMTPSGGPLAPQPDSFRSEEWPLH